MHRLLIQGALALLGLAPGIFLALCHTASAENSLERRSWGHVHAALPFRLPDKQVEVDYVLELNQVGLEPMMLLAAFRYGRSGLPAARTGWLTINTIGTREALGRILPIRASGSSYVGIPVVQVGDEVLPEASLAALGGKGRNFDADELFESQSAEMRAGAMLRLQREVRPLAKTEGVVFVGHSFPMVGLLEADEKQVLHARLDQLAHCVSKGLQLSKNRIHAVLLPVIDEEAVFLVEVRRVAPQEGIESNFGTRSENGEMRE